MKKLMILVMFLSLCQISHAEYFKHISLADGLNQFSVMAIYQDTLGRMWFGTKEGISIYNGSYIQSYRAYAYNHLEKPEKALIGNDIYAIQGNRHGDVFIIAEQSLLKYNIRQETFRQLTISNTPALASYNGDIWCVKNDSIYLYNDTTDQLNFVMKTHLKRVSWLTVTNEKFYIGAHNGLYVINRKNQRIEELIKDVDVYRIFESSKKEIWVGCRMEGLYRIDKLGTIIKVPYIPGSPDGISSYQIREFVEDNDQNIWFGTFDGLQKYNSANGAYSVSKLSKTMGGLAHPSVFSLYKDRQGTIWIGSYFGGVNYFNPEFDIFSRYNYDENVNSSLYFSYISSMTEDKENNLWICTDGGGVSCMNRQTYAITNFRAGVGNHLPHNNVKSICYDEKRNYLYIGTYIGGLSRYDIDKKQFHNYKPHFTLASDKEPSNIIFNVMLHQDRLYVSARNGFFMMNPDTDQFQLIYSKQLCQTFDVDEEGNMWLGLGKNIICIHSDRTVNNLFIDLEKQGCKFEITKVKVTKNGLYIASLGSGMFYYDKTTGKVTHYSTENNQLLSNYCYNLAETSQGNILITCNQGIMLFSPINQQFQSISTSSDFPASAIVNGCGVYVAVNHEIFVGDVEGITSFRQSDLKIPTDKLRFYLSGLTVNNQPIYPGDETKILDQSLSFVQSLLLKHDQNNLVITFALSNYVSLLQSNWYEYKLEGFDNAWIATKRMDLHYTNLDPGSYTLRIRAKGGELHTRVEEISQRIIISPPWFNTIWAWMVYVGVVSVCVYYFLRSRTIKRRLAFSLEKERFEKQQIEQMNQAKLLFFTNVSHEFRTPLTLIISHIELLLQNMSITPTLYSHVVKINKHALRMRNLVTELLDFRKFDQNHMTLKIAEQNLVDFVREIYFSFLEYAQQQKIIFQFDCHSQEINLWFDSKQLEKVIFNIVSNAFKYTPKGGTIEISIVEGDDICIKVTDSGTGIKAEETKYVFDRFYQAGNEQINSDIAPGTGIGLALSRSIIEKHHGNISVDSEAGKGSVFSVYLPKGKDHYLTDDHIKFIEKVNTPAFLTDSMPTPIEMEEISLHIEEDSEQASHTEEHAYTLLIVEDNEDLLKVLQQLFTPFYKTIIARNGKRGLELVISEKPDLIVSDVIMPEMTGTEMCIQIKNNIDTCHIPIVLLTALNTTEQNIEGLNRGADDYITKPFNAKILLARCNNLVRNRLLIQQQLTHKPISEIDLTAINPLDKNLLKQAAKIIDENIDDPEFDIPKLCKELGMGRTLLYAKFKALTGMTPNNFVLNHKLKKAANLLRYHPEMQIAEIAYSLGFGSSIYFSRCFKSQFNVSPQNYKKEVNETSTR